MIKLSTQFEESSNKIRAVLSDHMLSTGGEMSLAEVKEILDKNNLDFPIE